MGKEVKPGQEFFNTFNENVMDLLYDAVGRAYDTAIDNHDPERGANEQVFGFSLYHYAVHEIVETAARAGTAFAIVSRHPTFRFRVGDFELGCHRVGNNPDQDIRVLFPGNDKGIGTLLAENLYLEGMEPQPDIKNARKLVLAHVGDPSSGMGAIYLCIPTKTENGKISEWGYTHLIWKRSEVESPTLIIPKPLVPAEVIEKLPLERKPELGENTDEENG